MKRWMIGLLALLVIAIIAGAGILGRQSAVSSSTVDTAAPATIEVTRGDVRTTVTAPGHLVHGREATLAFGHAGVLEAVNVWPGDTVLAGDVLALLDPAPLRDMVAAAEIDLQQAQATLSEVQARPTAAEIAAAEVQLATVKARLEQLTAQPTAAELAAARAEVASAQADLQRLQDLPDPEAAAQAQALLEKSTAILQQAQAAYDAVRHRPDVSMLPQSLALQQATIDHDMAKVGLDAALSAPSPATIQAATARLDAARSRLAQIEAGPHPTELELAEMQMENAEAELARLLAGPDPWHVQQAGTAVRAAELALARADTGLQAATLTAPFSGVILEVTAQPGEMVAAGQGVVLLADSSSLEVEGRVIEEDLPLLQTGQEVLLYFDAQPDPEVLGSLARIVPQRLPGDRPLYPVIITVDQLPGGLLAGMTVDASIVTGSRQDVLRLPRAMVRARSDGTATVRVWTGHVVEERSIRTGLRGDAYVEILDGLDEGEQVVAQ